jgi:branched-chain amino acid transport system ATP-binding protein
MLEVERLVVKYGPIAAVRDVSLDVQEGEVVGIIGPNGAGKTTTLSAIFGLVRPAAGAITFEGVSLVGLTPESVVRKGIALVPEGRHIFGTLTVAENLQLGSTPRRDRRAFKDDLGDVFARFPILQEYYESPAGRLSGGEQQQLAIARALLSRPRLLLLDEPSLGLAPRMVDLVFEILAELRDEGVTVLLVEQNATRTVEFADRTYVLRDGVVRHSGTRREIVGKLDLAHAYLGVREEEA